MTISLHCDCGFTYVGTEVAALAHEPAPGRCCNCGGRKCMDCVLRHMHDRCEDSCPDCCEVPA